MATGMRQFTKAVAVFRASLSLRQTVPASQCTKAYMSSGPSRSWDYMQEKKNFKLAAPEYYNFARDVIDHWAEKERVQSLIVCCVFFNTHSLTIV